MAQAELNAPTRGLTGQSFDENGRLNQRPLMPRTPAHRLAASH